MKRFHDSLREALQSRPTGEKVCICWKPISTNNNSYGIMIFQFAKFYYFNTFQKHQGGLNKGASTVPSYQKCLVVD